MGAPQLPSTPGMEKNIHNDLLGFFFLLLCKNGNFYKKFIKQVQGMFAEIHLPAQKVQNVNTLV